MNDAGFADMITKIAHELRSPLTSIKGFSSTLVKRWDRFTDEQKLEFVETIRSDSERMSRVVAEVLDLARLEAGRLELNRANAHLLSIATQAREDLDALPGAERVAIDVGEDLMVWADVDRLGNVLRGLVENALKFSDDGPVVVRGRHGENATVCIAVTDQGVGIEPDRAPHVFEGPAPPGGRTTPSGTGLGLYLSRRLLAAHGGTISVDTQLGAGSTFTVSLPATERDA